MSKLSRHDRMRRARERKLRRLQAAGGTPTNFIGEASGQVEFIASGDGAATEGGPKKFTMTLYRGGRMRPSGFFCDVVCDLKGVKIAPGDKPAYLDHDRSKIVGHHTSMVVDQRGIHSEGVISGAGEAAREVRESAANGFPWKASVGGSIEEMNFIARGETAEANGKTWKGPIFVIRATTIHEGSFVSIAGDSTSSAKIAAHAALTGALAMGFEAWLQAKGFDPTAISDQQKKFLRATFDAEQDDSETGAGGIKASGGATAPTPPTTSPLNLNAGGAVGYDREALMQELRASAMGELRQDVSAEMQRHAAIRNFAEKYSVSTITADGAQVDFVAHAIGQNWSREKAELEAMRAGRPQLGPAIHTGGGAPNAQALEAALCISGGMGEELVAKGFGETSREQVMNTAMSGEYRGAKITTLMHDTIRAAGMYARPGLVNDDFVRTALRADRQLQASGPATISMSGILGNVANKALQAQYRAVPDVVSMIAAKSTAGDFKPMTRYRLTGDATFLEVGANGELKSFELGEESYTNAIKTFGRTIMLNRQMMRNDDLGAFLQLPQILGRGAGLCRNKGFFTLWLSNPSSFFSAGNGNYFEGAATPLSIASLGVAEKMFLEMKDAKGNFIEAMPALLLTAPGNKVLADQLYTDTHVNETTTANAPKTNSNPHAGKFKPVSTPYLGSASGIAGASDAAYYVLASPSDVPVAEIAYLDGNETPVLQSSEADFDVLGMKWRSFWDFGVAMANKTGGVKSKGAA